jgi:Replication protein
VIIRTYADAEPAFPPGVASLAAAVRPERAEGRSDGPDGPAEQAPSRHNGNTAAAGQGPAWRQERISEARAERMRLRRTMRKIAYDMCECSDRGSDGRWADGHRECWAERMAVCGLHRLSGAVGIQVRESAEHGRRASYADLKTCKSLSCPVCCGYLRERVAEKLVEAADRWDQAGNAALYVVLTIRHGVADQLGDLYAEESAMWRRITSSAAWKKLRAETGLEYLRTDEVTHGEDSGFHPHLNLFLVAPMKDTGLFMAQVAVVLTRLWKRECELRGLSAERGVHIEQVRSSRTVAEYVTKDFGIGREMVSGHAKRGHGGSRTFIEILADCRYKKRPADFELVRQYVLGTRGRRMLNASRGFWQLMATADIPKVSEDELAEELGAEDIGRLPADCWDRVAHVSGLEDELLKAAELGGQDAVIRLLAKHKAFLVDSRGMPIWPARAGPRPGKLVQGELELAL